MYSYEIRKEKEMAKQLDPEEIKQMGEHFITNVDKMYRSLVNIEEVINDNKAYFDNYAVYNLRNNIYSMAEKFKSYRNIFEEYGEYCKTFSDAQTLAWFTKIQ